MTLNYQAYNEAIKFLLASIAYKEKIIKECEDQIWALKKQMRDLDREVKERSQEKPCFVG